MPKKTRKKVSKKTRKKVSKKTRKKVSKKTRKKVSKRTRKTNIKVNENEKELIFKTKPEWVKNALVNKNK